MFAFKRDVGVAHMILIFVSDPRDKVCGKKYWLLHMIVILLCNAGMRLAVIYIQNTK